MLLTDIKVALFNLKLVKLYIIISYKNWVDILDKFYIVM